MDTYLKSKGGEQLFTVRSENWNERLGVVSADEVAVVVANDSGPLQPVTLRSVLQNLGQLCRPERELLPFHCRVGRQVFHTLPDHLHSRGGARIRRPGRSRQAGVRHRGLQLQHHG